MYHPPALGELLSQGDIFRRRCVFPYTASLTEDYFLVREGHEGAVPHGELADAWANNASEIVLLPTYAYDHSIVLSNSCDAESGEKEPLELILVGAVLPIESIVLEKNRSNCRSRKVIRYHYLEANEDTGFPESFVHFGLVALVRQDALIQSKNLRILCLNSPNREDLGHRFSEFISRVALP